MARQRQAPKRIIPQLSGPRKGKSKIPFEFKLATVRQYETVNNPGNKSRVSARYEVLRKFPLYLLKPASPAQIKELKSRGFFTTNKGVIIDGPRDVNRQPIKGARTTISKQGDVVFTSKGNRRDYVIGFTKIDRAMFAVDPNAFIAKQKEQLRARYPTFRNAKDKDIQVRIQWGAYQATKDYYPSYFTRTGTWEGMNREAKIRQAQDKMTGLHYVIHVKPTRKEKAAPIKSVRVTPQAKAITSAYANYRTPTNEPTFEEFARYMDFHLGK